MESLKSRNLWRCVLRFAYVRPKSSLRYVKAWSRDTVVGVTTGRRTQRPRNHGSVPGSGNGFMFSRMRPDWLWGPPSFAGGKMAEAGVKNQWSCTSRRRDNRTFYVKIGQWRLPLMQPSLCSLSIRLVLCVNAVRTLLVVADMAGVVCSSSHLVSSSGD